TSQTAWQQLASLQLGSECWLKHEPPLPQPAHSWNASETQMPSHSLEQQKGSAVQTSWQQSASLHAGVECSSKHEPASDSPHPRHNSNASLTQTPSHEVLQQNGSTAHTVLQQLALLQPGFGCDSKQLPAAG